MKKEMKMHIKNLLVISVSVLLFHGGVKAQISVLGEMTHEKNADPGETYTGTVVVHNASDDPEDMKIYQTDFSFASDGANYYDVPGTLSRSNASWINFSPRQTTVQPHEKAVINYQVTVPQDSNLIGTYWSMLMVEGIPEIPAEKEKGDMAIRVVMRYGIQMITNMGDTGSRQLKFFEPKLLREENKRMLQIDIENIGERWLRPMVWIELFNEAGTSVGTFEGSKQRVYPGTSTRFKINLNSIKEGTYKSLVVADCGNEDIFGVNYTLKIEK